MTKQFVVDYITATFEPLTEHEVGGLDYRYVYGNDRLSVNITRVETSSGNLIENGNQIRLYYHMDYLGTADYLTSPVTGKVTSWTHYKREGRDHPQRGAENRPTGAGPGEALRHPRLRRCAGYVLRQGADVRRGEPQVCGGGYRSFPGICKDAVEVDAYE